MSEQAAPRVGEQIRLRRENLGYTLADVAEKTRIRKVYLAHIEADEFEALPGDAYVKGFLRVYAKFLDIPAEPFISDLQSDGPLISETPSTDPTPDSEPHPPIEAAPAKPHSDWSMFFVGLSVVLILGCALYFLLDLV